MIWRDEICLCLVAKKLLHLVLAESALELIPPELWSHPEVRRDAARRRLSPGSMLLDRSYHHRAMLRLPNAERRGRPDIVHFALLSALGTPLSMVGELRVHVHTLGNLVVEVSPSTRLPRNYLRFKGLFEQALKEGRAPPGGASLPLLTVREQRIDELLAELSPSKAIGLSRLGEPMPLSEVAGHLASSGNTAAIVGGFPRGHFTDETKRMLNEVYAIDPAPLEAWVVTARLVYAVERAMGLEEKRIKELREARSTPR
ncbi:MAG: 16S rRNA methyltransferase [Candidatus Bathyarchaeia archaeon]